MISNKRNEVPPSTASGRLRRRAKTLLGPVIASTILVLLFGRHIPLVGPILEIAAGALITAAVSGLVAWFMLAVLLIGYLASGLPSLWPKSWGGTKIVTILAIGIGIIAALLVAWSDYGIPPMGAISSLLLSGPVSTTIGTLLELIAFSVPVFGVVILCGSVYERITGKGIQLDDKTMLLPIRIALIAGIIGILVHGPITLGQIKDYLDKQYSEDATDEDSH